MPKELWRATALSFTIQRQAQSIREAYWHGLRAWMDEMKEDGYTEFIINKENS